MQTVMILALVSVGPNLDSVVDFLKCFPNLEKLYVRVSLCLCQNACLGPINIVSCGILLLAALQLLSYFFLLIFQCELQKTMKNVWVYNALDPIECIERRLKKVVLKNYHGMRPDVDFAKFFVLNAKVLKRMEFETHNNCTEKWLANQHRRLKLEDKASRGAEFKFKTGCSGPSPFLMYTHSLLKVDPFNLWNQRYGTNNDESR